MRCAQVEALIQNVLSYPHLPPSIHRCLENVTADMATVTSLVECMADHFGKELTLWFLRKAPRILNHDFDTVVARADAARQLLRLQQLEVPLLLRKNPRLLEMDAAATAERYRVLHQILPLAPPQVRALALKYPVVLNFSPAGLEVIIAQLRQLAGTRDEWACEFAEISPSLLAFYIRDHNDLRRRLEYLVATGEAPEVALRDVFKPSNKLFALRHRGFRRWREMMERRAAAAAAAAEAAEVRLAMETGGSAEGGAQEAQWRRQADGRLPPLGGGGGGELRR